MRFRIVAGPLTVLLLGLSGCGSSVSSTNTENTTQPTDKPVQVMVATTKTVSAEESTSPESLIENGLSWKLSNGTTVSPQASDFLTNWTFGLDGVAAVRVPKVSPETYYFVFTRKSDNWIISGIIGAQVYPLSKPNHLLPQAYSELDGQGISIKGLGHFTEFYNRNTFITIGNIIPGANLPRGTPEHLTSGQDAILFKEDNIVGLYYPHGSNYVLIAGNIDLKAITSLANDKYLSAYTEPKQ